MRENEALHWDTYRIIKEIGQGGKGIVYLAKHTRLDRDVVLKVENISRPDVNNREVEVLKLLKHQYIPNVYDYFTDCDRTITVMDYIQGESLDKAVKNSGKFSQAQVIKWTRQLLEALDYLHSPTHGDPPRGFVHSDIKPANIMLCPNGDICLIDFNISLALGEERVTGYTPAYASPEHFGLDFSGSGSTGGAMAGKRVRGFDVGTRTGSKKTGGSPATEQETHDEELTGGIPRGEVSEGSVTGAFSGTDSTSGTFAVNGYIYNSMTGAEPSGTSDMTKAYDSATAFTDDLTGGGYSPRDFSPAANAVTEGETTVSGDTEFTGAELTGEQSQPASAFSPVSTGSDATADGSESVYSTESESVAVSKLWRISDTSKKEKKIVPDVRSDIYCLALTLYFLLTGRNPRRSPDREPKSIEDFILEFQPGDKISKPFADVLRKALEPDPEQRYQSAAEMLEAVNMMRWNDPRSRRLRRAKKITAAVSAAVFAAGIFTAFVESQRGNTEKTSAVHADESINLMESGDRAGALREALAGLPAKNILFSPEYLSKPQLALASASGVYDLRGGFTDTARVKLPGVPSFVRLSGDGRTGAAVCGGKLEIFSAETGSVIKELEADPSFLSEAEFIGNDRLAFAGKDGLTVYEISSGCILWTGEPATGIAVSGDGKRVAGVYKDSPSAQLYDAENGGAPRTVNFLGGKQVCPEETVKLNDMNTFELNNDGSALSVSVTLGSGDTCVLLLGTETGKFAVRGGTGGMDTFSSAFAGGAVVTACTSKDSRTAIYTGSADPAEEDHMSASGGGEGLYTVKAYGGGICIKCGGAIALLDAEKALTEGISAAKDVIKTDGAVYAFDTDGRNIILSDKSGVRVFGMNGTEINYSGAGRSAERNVCAVRNGTAVYGDRSSDVLQIARYQTDESAFFADYPADFFHNETRVSADGQYIMQFSSVSFRILDRNGSVIVPETALPENTADPQYRRDESGSCLEVTCLDGRVIKYDGASGAVLGEETGALPDLESTEFLTDRYRIVSRFRNSTAEVFDRASGKKLADLEKQDGELAYVYQAGDRLLMQYIVKEDLSDGVFRSRGYLLDDNFETVAEMEYLCDYRADTGEVYFDYPEGCIRKTKLYSTEELIEYAEKELQGIDNNA